MNRLFLDVLPAFTSAIGVIFRHLLCHMASWTIARLKLNSVECSKERQEQWDDYDIHGLHCQRLIEVAPFVAMEAARQGLFKSGDRGVHSVATIRAWLDT